MGKIEYLFYCVVLNGIVFLGELFVFYLAGNGNAEAASSFSIPWWSVASLIAMWLAEVGVLVVWGFKNWHEKRQQPDSNPTPKSEIKAVAQTVEAKATATAVIEARCKEATNG
jgi:hypothetical protein